MDTMGGLPGHGVVAHWQIPVKGGNGGHSGGAAGLVVAVEQIGGVAALAAVFVMITAVLGALLGPWLLRLFRITHPAAWGIAMGIVAHAVGTSRALEESEEAGAFAALGMSMMGMGSAVLLPLGVTVWALLF